VQHRQAEEYELAVPFGMLAALAQFRLRQQALGLPEPVGRAWGERYLSNPAMKVLGFKGKHLANQGRA